MIGLAIVLEAIGPQNVPDAIAILEGALVCDAENGNVKNKLAELLANVGVRLKHASLPAEARKYFQRAIEVSPKYAHAYYNIGVATADLGDMHSALQYYKRCVSLNAMHTEALANIGALYRSFHNDNEAAVRYYELALSTNPSDESTKKNLATALAELGNAQNKAEPKIARKLLKKALALDPLCAVAHYNLGLSYHVSGKYERAITCYRLAAHLDTKYAASWNNMGIIYKTLSDNATAVQCYKRALEVDPKDPRTHTNISVIYTITGDFDSALFHIKKSLSLNPNDPEAHNNYGVLLRDSGDIEGAIEAYDKSIKLNGSLQMPRQNRLHALHYSDRWTPRKIYKEHESWGLLTLSIARKELIVNDEKDDRIERPYDQASSPKKRARSAIKCINGKEPENCSIWDGEVRSRKPETSVARGSRGKHQKLRVGLFGGDWFTHAVAFFSEGLLKYHDPTFITLYVYSSTSNPDATTKRLKGYASVSTTWRDLPTDYTANYLHALVHEDKIDIAIDLSGHTAGNQLSCFADIPAPITATWIGYPNTSGLPLTYRISDSYADPIECNPESIHTEKNIWRLPHCFLGYMPPKRASSIPDPTPFLRKLEHSKVRVGAEINSDILKKLTTETQIVFGSFNIFAKMQGRCLKLWARLLNRVPGSRLVLKSRSGKSSTVRRRIWDIMEKHGVSPERVEIRGMTPTVLEHLEMYGAIDVALDTFPYAGTTTTFEAMYMGCPVVTLTSHGDGCAHVRNVGSAIMQWGGWDDKLVATNEDEWIEKVLDVLTDWKWRKSFRENVRDRLVDRMGTGERYCGSVREMWLGMWKDQGGVLEPNVPFSHNVVPRQTSCEPKTDTSSCESEPT
eukprot:Plantae.Rhodophyta-Hildenbrandia_rubra.ctg18775.p1 GENE.Plantae.Rhodophyta-Hildenbrandia_rubra.ctg18775~~Plantae.Rhodophyta-Hildenbrandia_rubra.ctg18775.p1  ORF type:complete len:853 (-),score=107.00 Plantae.Rhodophyta-Hildenbrandia_rubra.ctg18775:3177-5735(-)